MPAHRVDERVPRRQMPGMDSQDAVRSRCGPDPARKHPDRGSCDPVHAEKKVHPPGKPVNDLLKLAAQTSNPIDLFPDALTLQTRLADGWRDLYRFRDEAQSAADYQVYNWHTSAYPSSMFRSYLIAERLTPERRISLINSKLTERFADGRVVEQAVETPGALMRVLTEELGVEPPVDAETLFARLPTE